MAFNHRKTITFRLVQAAKAYRQRSANVLGQLNLHPGQDQILKALAESDGQTMGALALALSVQPPTITKMVARLGAQGLVERRPSENDGRSSSVYLTDHGMLLIDDLDKRLKQMEKAALKGIDNKDRKRLRKALRQLEHNLGAELPSPSDLESDSDDEIMAGGAEPLTSDESLKKPAMTEGQSSEADLR